MAVKKHSLVDYGAANLGGAQCSIFVCDTTAELPSGIAPDQFRKGDLATTKDLLQLWIASSSTTWKLLAG